MAILAKDVSNGYTLTFGVIHHRNPLDGQWNTACRGFRYGSMPQSTSSGYGLPLEGILPGFPNTTVSTSIVKSGRMSDQPMPTKVYFLRTSRSRQARK